MRNREGLVGEVGPRVADVDALPPPRRARQQCGEVEVLWVVRVIQHLVEVCEITAQAQGRGGGGANA